MVAILVGCGVAGCTGGAQDPPTTGAPTASVSPSEGDVTPTESASASVGVERPSPPPDRPDRPDGMDAEGEVAAEIAARYFLDLYGYAIQTGDLEDFEAMSSPECEFCRTVIEDTRALYEAGGWISSAGVTAGDALLPTELSDPSTIDIIFEVTDTSRQYSRATGSTIEKTDSVTRLVRIYLEHEEGRWQIVRVSGEGT